MPGCLHAPGASACSLSPTQAHTSSCISHLPSLQNHIPTPQHTLKLTREYTTDAFSSLDSSFRVSRLSSLCNLTLP